MRIQVALTLPREAVSVPLARRTVVAALRSAGITADCLDEVEVALSEACTNVVHHSGDTTSYDVVILVTDGHLTIDVTDTGPGFAEGAPEVVMPLHTAEAGRGLALMAALTDHAAFDNVTGTAGAVHLAKQLRWRPGAPLAPDDPEHRPLAEAGPR